MSYGAVGKSAKYNGVMPHPAIRKLIPPDRPTPMAVTGKAARKRFGYESQWLWGDGGKFQTWFSTAASRDQAMAAASKKHQSFLRVVGPVERD